ncbi:WG repeat-containing protein [Chloroflexi bacterium TSY]|nr:WG repeat-containing protein [Chloroflexi bacterium TSY]
MQTKPFHQKALMFHMLFGTTGTTSKVCKLTYPILSILLAIVILTIFEQSASGASSLVSVAQIFASQDTNSTLFPFESRKYGYLGQDGAFAIEPQFEAAFEFHEGLAAVKIDGRYGYIDPAGMPVIKPQFEAVTAFNKKWAYVRDDNGAVTIIDAAANVIAHVKDEAQCGDRHWFGLIVSLLTRNWCLPLDDIVFYGNGEGTSACDVIVLETLPANEFPQPCEFVRYGYKDATDKVILDPDFERAARFSEGLAAVRVDGKYGYIDPAGKRVIPPQFERAADFSEGLAAVRIDGKYGYIDPAGKRIIPPQFDPPFTYEDIRFSEGLAAVYVGGKVGYIDRRGKTVVPSRYTGRAYPYSGGFGLIQAEFDGFGPFHIIDANGELLTEEPIRTDLALFYTVQKSYIDLIFHNLSDVRAIPGVQCHTRSRTIPYADEAWHCVAGDEVFDPCFEQGDNTVSVDPNLAFLAIFSRDCRDFGVIYSDFGYRKQPISYLKIAQI